MRTNQLALNSQAADLLDLWRQRQGIKVVAALRRSRRPPIEVALLVVLLCDQMDAGERADLVYSLRGVLPHHLASCYEQSEGGINGKTFWVCGDDCPTMRERTSR